MGNSLFLSNALNNQGFLGFKLLLEGWITREIYDFPASKAVRVARGSLQGNLLLKLCFKDVVSGPRNVATPKKIYYFLGFLL
jgi:hypothetical protein